MEPASISAPDVTVPTLPSLQPDTPQVDEHICHEDASSGASVAQMATISDAATLPTSQAVVTRENVLVEVPKDQPDHNSGGSDMLMQEIAPSKAPNGPPASSLAISADAAIQHDSSSRGPISQADDISRGADIVMPDSNSSQVPNNYTHGTSHIRDTDMQDSASSGVTDSQNEDPLVVNDSDMSDAPAEVSGAQHAITLVGQLRAMGELPPSSETSVPGSELCSTLIQRPMAG